MSFAVPEKKVEARAAAVAAEAEAAKFRRAKRLRAASFCERAARAYYDAGWIYGTSGGLYGKAAKRMLDARRYLDAARHVAKTEAVLK